MHRCCALVRWLLPLLIVSGSAVEAQNQTTFITAVGAEGTDSFVFGTELWAISQLELLSTYNISVETEVVSQDADRLRNLADRTSDFALVRGVVPTSFARHLRAVMALWPNGVEKVGAEATQLLAHADVPDEIVYRITKMVFEHAAKFRSAHATMGIGSPHDAIVGVSVPFHPGAHRYYEELGLGSRGDATLTVDAFEIAPSISTMGPAGRKVSEVDQLAAVCRDAAARGVLDPYQQDALVEACDTYAFTGMDADFMDLSFGQGGPKAFIPDASEPGFSEDLQRNHWITRTPGLEPTM